MSNIKSYLPKVYDGFVEMEELAKTEDVALLDLNTEIEKANANQFILTSDESAISIREKELNIIPDPSIESLEFRKTRLINRLSMTPPFSLGYLKQKLDDIIGKDKWSYDIDYDNYTLYIESSAENQAWFYEILITINKIKPVNIIFINKPLNVTGMKLSENISYADVKYNYILGSWALGEKSIGTNINRGVVKMDIATSIQQVLLNQTALDTNSKIVKVRLNDTLDKTVFITKSVENSTITIEYEVNSTEGLNNITNIKLLNNDNLVLCNSPVFVPILDTIVIKHIIQIKEGV